MPQTLPFIEPPLVLSSPRCHWRKARVDVSSLNNANIKPHRRLGVICRGMLAPRKFMQKSRKLEVFRDAADEADQKNWRRVMKEIDDAGSAVLILEGLRINDQGLPRDLVLGTLIRFKQLKKWELVSEILEWLQTQNWWVFREMDSLMLITAYGKLGDFNKAEVLLAYMSKKGYVPTVISLTALMEAYGKGDQYRKAEAVFRRMQLSGPEPSAVSYQIILKIFVDGDLLKEAEEIFDTLLEKESPLKPDQKMFHMMIYMHMKAGCREKARKIFSLMTERGVERSTVTYNSLMSFENNYKDVSRIYDEMQNAGFRPDVVSYALLINAYGKARREEEALAMFEAMLDCGVRPTQKAYNILLDAFAISGMVEQARTVFKSMRRDRFVRDICSYTIMLSAYVNASDMEGAEKFFSRLKQDGLEPSVVTYGTLIKGYAKANNLERMMGSFEEMRSRGIRGNQTIYTTIMDAFGKNDDFGSAVFWYKEMVVVGMPPDQKAKNILLSLAKTLEQRKEADLLTGDSAHHLNVQMVGEEDSDDDTVEDDIGENMASFVDKERLMVLDGDL